MTDANGVTVSNGYADNNAPYDVATKTIANKRFQKVILYDGSGNEVIVSSPDLPLGALAVAAEITTNRPVGGTTTTTRIDTDGNDFTAILRAGDYVEMQGTTLALVNVSRKISAVTATYIDVETAFPTAPVAGVDTWDALRVTSAQTSGGRVSVSIGAVEAVSFSVTNAGLTELADAIGATALAPPASAIQIAGVDPDGFDGPELRAPNVVSRAPGASEYGIIARTIPSGIQAISRTVNSATFEPYGKVDGSALTTSYQDLLGMAGDAAVLRLFNSTEVPVIISFDAGSTDCEELGPYENISIDYYANDLILPANTIRVKLVSGSAPTNGGSVRASVTR